MTEFKKFAKNHRAILIMDAILIAITFINFILIPQHKLWNTLFAIVTLFNIGKDYWTFLQERKS